MSAGFAALAIAVGTIALAVAGYVLWRRALERSGMAVLRRAPEPGPADERRHDLDGRDRITALEARYRAVAAHLTVGFAVLSACTLLALVGVYVVFGRLHDSRVRAFRDACEQTNQEHQAIIDFVVRRSPQVGPEIRKAFPVEPNCEAVAIQRAATN